MSEYTQDLYRVIFGFLFIETNYMQNKCCDSIVGLARKGNIRKCDQPATFQITYDYGAKAQSIPSERGKKIPIMHYNKGIHRIVSYHCFEHVRYLEKHLQSHKIRDFLVHNKEIYWKNKSLKSCVYLFPWREISKFI